MFNIELLSIAENELAEAYDWYEAQQALLGNKFFKEVSYYLDIIAQNPYQFQIRYVEELRTASLNKFPFLIIYWIDVLNNTVYITSIFHTSRNPKYK